MPEQLVPQEIRRQVEKSRINNAARMTTNALKLQGKKNFSVAKVFALLLVQVLGGEVCRRAGQNQQTYL